MLVNSSPFSLRLISVFRELATGSAWYSFSMISLSSAGRAVVPLLRGAADQALQFGYAIHFDRRGIHMSDVLSASERMEIERACERLTYAYGRALDLGDMNAAADCFAENGSFAR